LLHEILSISTRSVAHPASQAATGEKQILVMKVSRNREEQV